MGKFNIGRGAALAALATVAGVTTANAQSAAPLPPPPTAATAWAGAPRTTEEDRQFKINGRLQYDVYGVSADFPGTASDQDYTRTAVRRAFIGVEGRFTQNWRYNVKFDLAPGRGSTGSNASSNNNVNEVRLDDAYLEYAAPDWSIFLGQNNQVSPMEDRDSSNYIPFNERSAIIAAAGFGKIVGADFLASGGNWSFGLGVHGDSANNLETAGTGRNEASFVIARATYAPIYERTPDGITLLHLGLSARERDGGGDGTNGATFTYSVKPEVGFNTNFVTIGGFEHDRWIGGEFAFQHNAFGAEAEYGQLQSQLAGAGERTFSGGYFDIFWSPTGESRNYSAQDGSFGRTAIRRTLGSDGGIGHIMLAARYDTIDLTDGASDGGKQNTLTAGITWMPISYVKFQLNASRNNISLPNTGINPLLTSGNADTFTFRTQIDW